MNSKLFVLKNPKFLRFLVYFLVFALLIFSYPQVATAAGPLTAISDVMTRLKTGEASNHAIQFTTPTGIANGNTVTLTFAAGFDISAVVTGDVTLEGAAVTSAVPVLQVLTITAGAGNVVAATGTANIVITNNHIINPGAGSYIISIAGTFTDTGSFAVVIIANDQVVVSTTIDPYITFTLGQTTISLTKSGGGNPSYTSTGYNQGTANTLAVITNAATGYTISYNGATLTSSTGPTIDAMATKGVSATNTEQFGINLKANTTPSTGANVSGGSGAAASDYNTADNYRFIAGATTALASAGAASTSSTFTVTYIANVTQTTEAGAYNTTITYIATGNF